MPGPVWLTRNVRVLSAVSFAQDAASELLYPILPIFLTGTLGAPVAVVGAVEGAAEGAAAVTKLVAGRLADRLPRKALIALGYGAAALGKVLVALAAVWPVVLLGRVVDRLGKGVRGAPRDSLLVDGVPRQVRGRVIGFHRTADTAGAVVGPLLGLGALALFDGDLRKALLVAVIPAAISVLLVALVRDPRRELRHELRHELRRELRREPAPGSAGRPPGGVLGAASERVPLGRPLRELVVVLAVFGLANFPDALLLLRAHELGLSTSLVVLAYVVYNLSYTALSYPAGALSDRLPRHRVYAIGALCFAVAYGGLGLATQGWQVFALLVVYGGFAATNDGVGKAWVSTLADDRVQGWAQGLFQGVTGGAVLVAGLWAGLAWGDGGRLPLLVSAVLGLALAVVMLLFGRRWLPSPHPVAMGE